MQASSGVGRGRPTYPHSARNLTAIPLEDRLAHEAPLAVVAVLFRAHDRARALEAQLELEAEGDERVAGLYRQAKALRKAIAALLVEVVAEASEARQ